MKNLVFRAQLRALLSWINKQKIGLLIIALATAIFFAPILSHLSSYSEGGDSMFNAWLISRNHNCILKNNCEDYTTSNIYFPNQDSMLYSETELSAAVLTLPLYFINKNPIFAYNIWTILSFFFAGFFMYILAKYLSKNNELFSILAGLIFAFAPIKMSSVSHLQNLSIFYLPLIILFLLKYFEKDKTRYLGYLYIILVLQFYASWYQMVFVMLPIAAVMITTILKKVDTKSLLKAGATIVVAVASTFPLAIEYIQFSKSSGAAFSLMDQVKYSASLKDYLIPYQGTILGKAYYHFLPEAQRNAYNPDSFSYIGIGMILLILTTLFLLYRFRKIASYKNHWKLIAPLMGAGLIAFILSLGPLLKIDGKALDYTDPVTGIKVLFPLPYILVDRFLPQLSFIRAVGRFSIIVLFVACCLLALLPKLWSDAKLKRIKTVSIVATLFVVIELLPIHQVIMAKESYNYNFNIPAVYKYIKKDGSIKNFIVLASDPDYPRAPIPVARAEWVLWAGYHNKNIFNGYSGYTPKNYFDQYGNFLDFDQADINEMKRIGLDHVLVDKELSKNDPRTEAGTRKLLGNPEYEDRRYVLYKLQ